VGEVLLRERDPFGTALGVLRLRLKSGAYPPGEPLPITDLARELGLSPTPVREALSRLAGQGLVEDRRGRGYFVWRLDALDLVELYDLHALFVGAALGALQARGAQSGADHATWETPEVTLDKGQEEIVAGLSEVFFARVVEAGATPALGALYATLATRLGPARRAEVAVLEDLSDELARLDALFDQARWAHLAAAVDIYHERRRQAAASIAAVIRKYDRNI
jgi:DNA-binding GntR family transcriptional regulator